MSLGSHFFSTAGHTAALLKDRLAPSGRVRQVYSEESFHRVLAIERSRARVSNASFLLLFVRLKNSSGNGCEISAALAARIFNGLRLCFREVDFVGWHRQGRVAGAVLAQGPLAPGDEALTRIVARVTSALTPRLPLFSNYRFDVRIVRLRGGAS